MEGFFNVALGWIGDVDFDRVIACSWGANTIIDKTGIFIARCGLVAGGIYLRDLSRFFN